MKNLITISILFIVTGISSYGQSCDIDGILYSTYEDVSAILDSRDCGSCHKGNNRKGNWNYNSYQSFMEKGDCGQPILVNNNASESYFYTRLTGIGELCGVSNDLVHSISKDKLDQIETWINQGAPEFCMPLYNDIRLILNQNGCQECHNSNPKSWRYDFYQELISSGTDGNCGEQKNVLEGNANESLLMDKINGDGFVTCGDEMNSSSGEPMSYRDIAAIRDWINGGANESSATLPVVLSRYVVEELSGEIVLEWTTEVEIVTDKFIIEHSRNGRQYTALGEVKAKGGSFTTDYKFIDDSPLFGENYYRLKILDLDGSFDYSNIRLVRSTVVESTLSIFPNPAMSDGRLIVKWYPNGGQEATNLDIVDVNGLRLQRRIIFEGTNYIRLPKLLDGVYYILVEDIFGSRLLERMIIFN